MDNIKIPPLKNEEDAKAKAQETLKKIFDNKMLTIDNIKLYINEFHKKENQNSIEVFNKIERNISELDSSLKAIDQMILNMTEASHKHYTFYQSWQKITNPINEYGEDLEKLMLSKKNVSFMTHNLDMYVKVQDQVEEMKRLMEDDNNIVVVYKQIRYLAYLRVALLERVKTQARSDKLNNLADHMMCVAEFEDEFFDKFWSYFSKITTLATERPEFLVKLLRLIEEDPEYLNNIRMIFKTYHKPDDKYEGLNRQSNIPTSSDVVRETVALYESESEQLSEVLKSKIPLFINEDVKTRFQDKQTREEILDETLTILTDLYLIKTKVAPCFPPKYNIFELYKEKYLEHIKDKIKNFLNQEELEKTPGLLIPIAHWLDQFDTALKKVGLDIGETDFIGDITYYMHLFFDHVNEVLDSNLTSVINKNREDKMALRQNKKLDIANIQSYYATDIYSSLQNVVDLLCGDFKGQLLFQIVKTIMEKLMLLIKNSEDEIDEITSPNEIVIVCVYVYDASKCLELFPQFKKKIKSLLPKEFYDHIKLRFIHSTPSVLSMYNGNIKKGCNKAISLMFKDLSKTYLSKIFTSEWNDDVLISIFGTFREYFNQGFAKLLKSQNNLLIVVRCFIDNFANYYIEELIHSIRSLNRKTLKGQSSPLCQYVLGSLEVDPSLLVYKEKEKDKDKEESNHPNEHEQAGDVVPGTVKDLDKLNNKKEKSFKKYKFPVKKFKKEDKKYNPLLVLERIEKDMNLFDHFLEGFSDEAKEPFSKLFLQTLGENFINSYVGKFKLMIAIVKAHSSVLKEQIVFFKEYFSGECGKALLESLLYVREDKEAVTKADMKLFLLNAFDCK